MKRTLYLLAIMCFLVTSLVAQQKKHMSHEEYCQILQKYITEKAKITPEEAKEFFPLYFELQQSKWKINKEARLKIKKNRKEPPTDEEFEILVEELANAKIKIAKLEKSYVAKYLKIISAKKILDVQYAEQCFQKDIFKKMSRHNKKEKTNN